MKRTGEQVRTLATLALTLLLAGACSSIVGAQPKRPGSTPPPGIPASPGGAGGNKNVVPGTDLPPEVPTTTPGTNESEGGAGQAVFIIIILLLVVGLVAGGFVVVKNQQQKKKENQGGADASGTIGGYRLLNHLYPGQASQVWEVVEASSGRHFAMKILLEDKINDSEHRRLLFHEAEVGLTLAHPNIIRIVKVMKSSKTPNFVMEFFPSGSLRTKITQKQTDFFREFTHGVLKQIATALAFMNAQGWVHRDVKPDNILVNAAGEAKLIDFALAARISRRRGLRFGKAKAMGTRSYMSPEQIRGQPLDGRADIYSFGATCYEIVAGRPPFRGASSQDLLAKHISEKPASPRMHNPDVTEEFSDLVLHMLAKKPDQRPKDFHEVLMRLRNIKVFKSEKAQPTAKE